jgi:hypothetical protein
MRRRPLAAAAVLVGLAAAGCSLVNSLDPVERVAEGDVAAADAAVAPLPSASAPPDAGPDVPDAPIAPGTLEGAIVVAGQVEDDAGVLANGLTVLDPKTGAEIDPAKRESMTLAAIRYDGLRDLWYLFESGNGDFVPGAADTVFLHVRQLDATGTWTELSKTQVPAPQWYESIAVLRERIGYVAYAPVDSGSSFEFASFDTSDPASVKPMDTLDLPSAPVTALGTRSSTGPGGVVNLLRYNAGSCDGGLCDVEYLPVRVPNSGQPVLAPVVVVGQSKSGSLVGASYAKRELDLVLFPRVASGAPTTAQLYQPITAQPEGMPSSFTISDTGLRRPAIAECDGIAFTVGTNSDVYVHAIPLTGDGTGTPAKESTGHSGQSVYFEPYTKTVIAPFSQGAGYDYTAFRLGGTPSAPTLTARKADWAPPKDLRPILLGIRSPLPFPCP